MDKPTCSDMMPKRAHEKDMELDKKIEALRRKNAALMKRYQEVEEDRKKAEEEGMALQCRKGKADDLSITISKSTSDGRVVMTKSLNTGSDQAGEGPSQGAGRGQRKQLMITMAAKKGKRVVSEKPEKRPDPADMNSDDGQSKHVESARGKQTPHKKDTAVQDEVKQGEEQNEEHHSLSEHCQILQACTDLNIPTSKEEQEEYLQWKKEREQIDRERVARHKNAKGQWRRAWDMDKSENMFSGKSGEWGPSSRGGRKARRGQTRTSADSQGHVKRGKAKEGKNVQVMSSKAKGKDRLTGRARRWQVNKEGENLEDSETTLEDFLEELDALTDSVVVDQTRQERETKTKDYRSPDLVITEQATEPECLMSAATVKEDCSTQEKAASSPPRGLEKKVRFSDELVKESELSQEFARSESRCPGSIKGSSPKKNKPQIEKNMEDGCILQDEGRGLPPAPVTQLHETECTPTNDSLSSPPARKAQSLDELLEVGKCNMSGTNTEELIDSGLSVLSLESGETHQAHSTSSDKAREHGKIV